MPQPDGEVAPQPVPHLGGQRPVQVVHRQHAGDQVVDLIAGVLVVNDLHGALAAEVRYGLWCDLTDGLGHSTSAA